MRYCIKFILTIFLISSFSSGNPVPFVDENDLIHDRHALMQTHTGYNQTEIHGVLPRLKNFKIKIQKIVNEELVGPEILFSPALEAQDPQKVLHQKINIFHLDGLDPNSEYHMELMELSSTKELNTVDRRRLKTLDPKKKDPRFTVASCMCDETRYNPIKIPIWTQKRLTKPDFMFLIGDITYVDSFDVVNKPDITTLDIWQRYINSFTDNPVTRQYRMTSVISGWDDHDSSNNSTKHTPTLKESLKLFNLLYGGRTIPGVIENGPEGTYKWLSYGKTEFAFLDARSFREKLDIDPSGPFRYGHLGEEQEKWFFKKAAATTNPLVILKGDMFGSEVITKIIPETGEVKRITESFFGDHPLNYSEFMKSLQQLPNPYVFISGDIHRAQFIRHGPLQTGSRWNPFPTAEWTTSPLYSFRFNPQDPNPGWDDKDRYGHKNIYNFGLFKVTQTLGEVKFEVEIRGDGKTNPDGSPRDWTTLAPPALTDTLILKAAPSKLIKSCSQFYRL